MFQQFRGLVDKVGRGQRRAEPVQPISQFLVWRNGWFQPGPLPDVSKLLLVTFTKDAARELAERVRRVLSQLAAPPEPDESEKRPDISALRPLLADDGARSRLNRALLDLDLLAVSTIHAFCQRTLQHEGSLCGLPVLPEVTTDDSAFLDPIVRKLWITTLSSDATLAAIATAENWQLRDALRLINTLRRSQRPVQQQERHEVADGVRFPRTRAGLNHRQAGRQRRFEQVELGKGGHGGHRAFFRAEGLTVAVSPVCRLHHSLSGMATSLAQRVHS